MDRLPLRATRHFDCIVERPELPTSGRRTEIPFSASALPKPRWATLRSVTTKSAPERSVHLSLVCSSPPASPGMPFGLQDTAGHLTPGVNEPDGSIRFEVEIQALTVEGSVRFRGPVVHGPPTARFLYLSCRSTPELTAPWVFRLKVPLDGIPADATSVEGHVRATQGGTVRLLGAGWTASSRGQPSDKHRSCGAPPARPGA